MFKKTIALALTAVVTCLSSIAQARSETGGQAQGQPDKAASVKAQVRKIGIGESFVVRVKLKDGTDLRGYLSQIENDSFTITDKATIGIGAAVTRRPLPHHRAYGSVHGGSRRLR